MALVHEFFLISPAPISEALAGHYRARPEEAAVCQWPTGKLLEEALGLDARLMAFYEQHRRTGLELHDDLIQPLYRQFSAVPALWNGCIPHDGLNYYAITCFETKHLPALRAAIAGLAGLEPLADLCLKAERRGMDIVHFGI